MSRDLTADFLAEIEAAALRPVRLVEAEFTGGWLRLWTGIGAVSWNGETWAGAGNLLGISEIAEASDVRAVGITVSLSGLNTSIIALALAQARQGLPCRVYEGMLDGSGAIIADPLLSFEGRLDVPEIDDSGETCAVSISYESRLIDLERPRERRITHEDQQIDYPGDQGRAQVAVLQDKVVTW